MLALAGEAELVWCVPEEQRAEYRAAGATAVETGHPGQREKMNEVLDRHGDEWVAFSDDDCVRVRMLTAGGDLVDVTLAEAVAEMIRVAEGRRDRYVALSMAQNERFMSRSITPWGQTANWLCAIAPNTPERFATKAEADELVAADAEFAAKIVDRYGRMCRPNYIQAKYRLGDAESHWRESHARSEEEKFGWIVRKYPHLFKGWRAGGTLIYRPLPRAVRR